MSNNQFDKFMKDILYKNENRNISWQLPPLDQKGVHEEYMKRLRMMRERELWQNRINWSR
jgi:hypothetical protein